MEETIAPVWRECLRPSRANCLLAMGKQERAVVRDEAKGHVWESKDASVAVAEMTDGDSLGRAIAGSEAVFVMLPPLFDPSPGFPEAEGLIDSLSVALRQSEAERIVALSTIGAHVNRPNLLNGLHMVGSPSGSSRCRSRSFDRDGS